MVRPQPHPFPHHPASPTSTTPLPPSSSPPRQPTSRKTRLASDKYHNRNKGDAMSSGRKKTGYTVGPVLLGFFLFVVVGSCE